MNYSSSLTLQLLSSSLDLSQFHSIYSSATILQAYDISSRNAPVRPAGVLSGPWWAPVECGCGAREARRAGRGDKENRERLGWKRDGADDEQGEGADEGSEVRDGVRIVCSYMKVKFEEEKMKMVMAKDSADDFLSDEKLNLTILKQVI
ncbi:hypothetical protein HN51_005308 [Arachis hypogaea]